MARLNEPPIASAPSAETIEAVKRRFLRQNRELAKTNSQQSIRIRSLENDASRLLAENLSLREQVLHLQNALETQSNRPSFENIDAVKDRLEAKIQELGGLVAELGQLHKIDTLPRCKSQTAATRRSPDERQWRSGLGLQDVQNAMMPTIAEDKYFPRRTMNEEELEEILDYPDSQSPDIGPPPVSRFGNEEPVSYNSNAISEDQIEELVDDTNPPLSANLETRKKRRESGPKLDLRRISVFQSPPPPERPEEDPVKSVRATEDATKSVRVGAKRKFSVQDDGEKVDTQTEPFQFSRRNTPSAADDGTEESRSQSPERPVLGSKPVNTDPIVSPKKQRSSAMHKPDKKPSTTSRSTNGRITIIRRPMADLSTLQAPSNQPEIAEINIDSLPPKTPAADDIFSPPSTEPSTARPDSKDTPPPGDLGSCGQVGLGARPSRRVRAQVSYKEPALNVKMRRPGKELVDAVQLPPDKRTSGGSQTAPLTSGKVSFQHGSDGTNSAWNALPSTTIRSADEELGSPLRQKLDRREGSQGQDSGVVTEPPKLNSSAASNAISALLNASISRRKSTTSHPTTSSAEPDTKLQPTTIKTNDTTDTISAAAKQEEKDNLAIFDFTDSSPADRKPRNDLEKNSRRHSTAVPSYTIEERKQEIESKAKPKSNSSLPSLHTRMGSGSGVKSISHLNKSTVSSRNLVKDKKPSGALPTSGSSIDLKTAAIAAEGHMSNVVGRGTGSLRAERAASRRKSMML
ncbi:hypothetical protein K505DRAFT_374714 [Melanomma pulvis-pyrius CBS 109.77]|uniref:Shugoshin n=1 Tax=Melanomma pulvis-pyrius CBS 109.77 TaxID=1314802 RepID=A0A6A6XE06_9PLEO|nr:hypothetical protein K505DRAFT_374714 [Melanomma pulvis-pyrius CBS 109.77]